MQAKRYAAISIALSLLTIGIVLVDYVHHGF